MNSKRHGAKLLIIMGLGCGLSFQSALAEPRVLTLDESIQIALKEATSVLKAESDTQVRGDQLLQSYLQWLPNLTLQAGYTEYRGNNFLATATPTHVKGSSDGASYQITSVLNIFNGLGDYSSFKSANEKKSATDKTFERVKQQITLDISQSFLQVVLDAKLQQIAENNYKTSQDREKLLDAQSKVGTRSLSDLFRQQAQTSADESALISARNRLETDKITFLKKLRIDPRSEILYQEPKLDQDIAVVRKAGEQSMDVEQLIVKALDSRVDLKASQQLASATESDVRVAQAPYYPRLDFVATYASLSRNFDYQRVNGIDQTPANQPSFRDQLADNGNSTYGLAFTWTIFDRFVSRSTVSVSRGVAYRAKLDAEDYRNQVIGEVRQVLNDRRAAIQQLITSKVGLTAAQKAFEVTEGRYGVGALNFVDLSAAQTALFQAQSAFAQALISYELQKRAFVYVLGTNV